MGGAMGEGQSCCTSTTNAPEYIKTTPPGHPGNDKPYPAEYLETNEEEISMSNESLDAALHSLVQEDAFLSLLTTRLESGGHGMSVPHSELKVALHDLIDSRSFLNNILQKLENNCNSQNT